MLAAGAGSPGPRTDLAGQREMARAGPWAWGTQCWLDRVTIAGVYIPCRGVFPLFIYMHPLLFADVKEFGVTSRQSSPGEESWLRGLFGTMCREISHFGGEQGPLP